MRGALKYQLREKGAIKNYDPLPKSLHERLSELPTAAAVVLGLIGIAGLCTMAVFAPNAVKVFGAFLQKRTGEQPRRHEIETKLLQAVYYLKKTGKIKVEQRNASLWITLGVLSTSERKKIALSGLTIKQPTVWNGTYWLVAADIPTKGHRAAADAFRAKLVDMGFYPLQRTLWLHPYNPKRELQLLVEHFGIARFVTLMHVSALDTQDQKLATAFWKKRHIL